MKLEKHFGGHYLIRGFAMLGTAGIKRYVILPALINTILFIVLLFTGVHYINHFTLFLPSWLHWLRFLFNLVFFIASFVILIYLFTIITNLLGAPFNSLLSEKVEILLTNQKPNQEEGIKDAINDIPRTLKREWHKILYYLPRALLLLLIYFIPVVNIIAGIVWFIFSSWMMAIQYLDYPFDNHRTTFQKMKQHLREHGSSSLSFGLTVVIFSMIPIINFVIMPAAVIGATVMYVEREFSNSDANNKDF